MQIMQYIKRILFGFQYQAVDNISTGLHTVHPNNQPSQEEWLKEYRVSMLYDRKPIYLN
jgi:hypothetical protein